MSWRPAAAAAAAVAVAALSLWIGVRLALERADAPRRQFVEMMTYWCSRPEPPQELAADLEDLDTVHVVYASDAGHLAGLLASMLSLSRHLAAPRSCRIHVLVEAANLERARSVVGCLRRELAELSVEAPEVRLHELRPVSFDLGRFYAANYFTRQDGKIHDGRHSMHAETFARFYLHEYLPAAPRALWIDTDTIVRADVRPLYQTRMRHPLAAVPLETSLEAYATHLGVLPRLPEGFVRPGAPYHFNAGVLLMDLRLWRDGNLSRALEQWVRRMEGVDGDQLALNLEFHGRYDPLDWRWNGETLGFNPFHIPEACSRGAKILHWAGPHKPWNASRLLRLPNEDLYEHPRGRCDF